MPPFGSYAEGRGGGVDSASLSRSELARFGNTLVATVNQARSVREIEAWLASQPYVSSVRVGDYLLKSNPPQRHITVALRVDDGEIVVKVINIAELGDDGVRFQKLSDGSNE